MSLARKYRPLTFKTFTGNEVTKRKLLNTVKNNKVPRSIIFEGDSGCGKTTLARILGKTVLCQSPNEDGTPCETCGNCKKITEKFILVGGRVPGIPIQEIDVSKAGSKEAILDLIDEMKTKPMGNAKKVYILDEVQAMGRHAQSSLLKIAEEPNEWLYIMLCTTDPDDLLPPLRNRLTPFRIRKPTMKEIRQRLEEICLSENIAFDRKALDLIIKVSKRTVRTCLVNLESLSGMGDVTYDSVHTNLEMVTLDTYIDYMAVLDKEIYNALEYINNLYEESGIEEEEFLEGLSEFAVDSFNIKMGVGLEDYTEEEAKAMKKAFQSMDTRGMINFLKTLEDTLKMIDNPKYALTMLTLKVGFPTYFQQQYLPTELTEEVKREERQSLKNYKENKKNQQTDLVEQELDDNFIREMFPDSFNVIE